MKPDDGSLDATMVPEVSGHGETISDTQSDSEVPKARPSASNYTLGEVLGRGGMGEVVLAEDVRIGRHVAVKRMRSEHPTPEATARFLREAKIQARLDHPAIVPVHELGHDAQGRPFFTMKRLTGTTLADVLATKRESQPQKLLRIVVEVCQAIQFAHARDVIHRDLKPANIQLGEYGEVYVLDWGVARVLGDKEHGTSAGIESLDPSYASETQAGAVLGTPGYMSPEQVRGEPITPATDVHALGAILYEVLAGQPAYVARGNAAMIATIAGGLDAPSKRAPERPIPPELDEACMKALAPEASDRPTAGELADAIQRYLDGDRDLERRRVLATEYLAKARAAIESGDPARRAEAMAAAGRAMALDPESDAAALVTQLMIEPPKTLPAELAARLAGIDDKVTETQAKLAIRAMATFLLVIPTAWWMGIKDWTILAVAFGLVGINALSAKFTSVRRNAISMPFLVLINAVVIITFGRIVGPFVFTPGLFGAICVALIMLPPLLERPLLVIGTFVVAFFVPIVLEAAGIWTSTWEVAGDKLSVMSPVVHFEPLPTVVFLCIASVALMIVSPIFVRSLAILHRDARRAIEIQAWHLEQLLPKR